MKLLKFVAERNLIFINMIVLRLRLLQRGLEESDPNVSSLGLPPHKTLLFPSFYQRFYTSAAGGSFLHRPFPNTP